MRTDGRFGARSRKISVASVVTRTDETSLHRYLELRVFFVSKRTNETEGKSHMLGQKRAGVNKTSGAPDFLVRSRWAAIGAAVAVSVGAGGLVATFAATSSPSSFVPITPCRIMDTRSSGTIGPRNTPLNGGQDHIIQVRGTNGSCTIPADATGVVMNVTSLNATANSYLTVWPTDVARPTASALNWTAGQPPNPNAVTTQLANNGQLSFWIESGRVDLLADITGYYQSAGAGGAGPQGPAGPAGPPGLPGADAGIISAFGTDEANTEKSFPTDGTDKTIVSLLTGKVVLPPSQRPGTRASGPIAVTGPTRIMINASADFVIRLNNNVRCSVVAREGRQTSVNATLLPTLSAGGFHDIANNHGPTENFPFSVTASIDVATPGLYDVALVCKGNNVGGFVPNWSNASITATAYPIPAF